MLYIHIDAYMEINLRRKSLSIPGLVQLLIAGTPSEAPRTVLFCEGNMTLLAMCHFKCKVHV